MGKLCISDIDNEYQSVFGCVAAMNGILQINKDNDSKQRVRNTYFTENDHSFAFIGNCCVLEPSTNQKIKKETKYGELLRNGSIVDVILDCNAHTLKYKINGKDYGIAYHHIPSGKYCLAVTMTQKNDRVQLLSYSGQQFV